MTSLAVPTPHAGLPWSPDMFAALGDNYIPRADGRGAVSLDRVEAAYEVMSYATLAARLRNQAFEVWDNVRAMQADGEGPGTDIVTLAYADYLMAERQVATILPVMAALFERHHLTTADRPAWMARYNLGWDYLVEYRYRPGQPAERVETDFLRPADWATYGNARLRGIEAALDELDEDPRDGMGATMGFTGIEIALIIIAVVGALTVGYVVIAGANHVFQYLFYEREMLATHLECAETNLADWVATGNDRALEAYQTCHEQAVLDAASMDKKGWVTWLALGAAGYVGYQVYLNERKRR